MNSCLKCGTICAQKKVNGCAHNRRQYRNNFIEKRKIFDKKKVQYFKRQHWNSFQSELIGPRQANLCLRAFRHDKF